MDRNVKSPIGNLYRLDADLSLHDIDQGFIISNGPCFSPDGSSLYFNDSRQQVTWRYPIDPVSGAAGPRSRLIDWGSFTGRPDGATVDAEGGLWVAEVHGRRVVRFTPDGQVDRTIEIPCERPTSVCFGGPDMGTMFITTSTLTLNEQDLQREPLTGGLFAVDAGVRGLADTAFGG
jgi:sugar lactone lactonase YvrE